MPGPGHGHARYAERPRCRTRQKRPPALEEASGGADRDEGGAGSGEDTEAHLGDRADGAIVMHARRVAAVVRGDHPDEREDRGDHRRVSPVTS